MSENSTIEYPIELTIKIGSKRWWRPRTTILTATGTLEQPIIATPNDATGVIEVETSFVQPIADFLLDVADDWETVSRS